jgi:hypothetical protein
MTQFSLLLALNIAGLLFIFLFVRARIRKALDAEGLKEILRQEIGQLVRDLNQTTDRNITLLEDALRSLKEAMAEADRRVEVLKRESERRVQEGAVYDRLGRLRTSVSRGSESGGAPRNAEPAVSASRYSVPASPAPETPAAARPNPEEFSAVGRTFQSQVYSDVTPGEEAESLQPSIPFVTFSSTPLRAKPPLKEEVISLNRRGISAEFIAAKLGITVAEVELIVSLEEQKGRAGREGEP